MTTAEQTLNPTPTRLIAIEIGGTKLQLCAGTATGEILERCRLNVDRARGAGGIREQIAATLPQLIGRWQPAAIGVGYGGPLDWRTGRIWRSYHVEGWSDFPLGEWLSSLCKLPVFVDNDAEVAALGEAVHGAGVGFNPVFYTTVGSGVGGGLVLDQQIYHGAKPGELEIGHLRLDLNGTTTEDRCSGWSVDRRIRAALKQSPASALAACIPPGTTSGEARYLGAALAQGDATAQAILTETVQYLSLALSHVVHLTHPEIIIIGGGLSLLGQPLLDALRQQLPKFIMDAFQPGPQIVLAALREDAVPVGALTLAAQRLTAKA